MTQYPGFENASFGKTPKKTNWQLWDFLSPDGDSCFVTMNEKTLIFPYFTKGIVVKGFGRGSKELGIPTGKVKRTVIIFYGNNLFLYLLSPTYVWLKN